MSSHVYSFVLFQKEYCINFETNFVQKTLFVEITSFLAVGGRKFALKFLAQLDLSYIGNTG